MTAAATSRPAGPRRRRIPLLFALLVALVLLALGGRSLWRRLTAPPPPEIDLGGVDPQVVRVVSEAREMVRKHPYSAEAWGMLGKVLRAHDYNAEADACFDRAEALDPEDARWPYLIARGPRGTDPDDALPYLERAAQRCGAVSVPRLVLAEVLLDKGRLEEAEAQFRAVLEREPGNARAHLGLGRLALARGDLEGAREHLSRSALGAPKVKVTHALLAEVNRRTGDADAAAEELRAMAGLTDDPAWPDPYLDEVMKVWAGLKARLLLAEDLHQRGLNEESLQLLRRLTQDYPDDHRPFFNLGRILTSLGRGAEAEGPLRTAARLVPDKGLIPFELGHALQEQGKDDEAVACYRTALRLQPSLAMAHYNLSFILTARGDREGARHELREAVRYKPDFALGYRHLGDLLARDGEYAAALRELETAAELAPADEATQELLGQVRAHLGGARP
jgi:tetratricopeptide (TPR) repeat protein